MPDVVPKRRGRPPKPQPTVFGEAQNAQEEHLRRQGWPEEPSLPAGSPPVAVERTQEGPPYRPDKVPYAKLAEELCDWIIAATEGHPRASRYPVCHTAMTHALKLLPLRYVKQTKRAA